MKKKHIIAIGFKVDKKSGNVTGLSMMFELFCKIAKDADYEVHQISLNSKYDNETVGIVGYFRLFEYVDIMIKTLNMFFKYPKAILYFNPSTTKSGAYRDVLLINLSRLFGYKILLQQFGALFESFYASLSKTMRVVLNYSYLKANIIIVEGEYAKRQYKFARAVNNIIVINNGLPETENVKQLVGKSFISKNSFELFYMNNMIESKGYIDVLKAIDILVNDFKLDVHCTFAGKFMKVVDDELFSSTNDAQKWFNQFIIDHNLGESVTYYNCVFGQEKAECFVKSNVFLLPSYYIFEGQPTAILEALSYGVVPIVTNYRLIPDMVNESCGIFVDAKQPNNIANAILYLMNNPDKYREMSQNCINVFYDKFSQEKYACRIINLLKDNF